MAPSSDDKRQPEASAAQVSLKLPPGEAVAAQAALDRIEAHVLKIAPHWDQLTQAQRDDLLAHSPVLARFIALARQFGDWQ